MFSNPGSKISGPGRPARCRALVLDSLYYILLYYYNLLLFPWKLPTWYWIILLLILVQFLYKGIMGYFRWHTTEWQLKLNYINLYYLRKIIRIITCFMQILAWLKIPWCTWNFNSRWRLCNSPIIKSSDDGLYCKTDDMSIMNLWRIWIVTEW